MPYRVKVYLIFWIVIIVFTPLVILYKKHNSKYNVEENFTPAPFENIPKRKSFINKAGDFLKRIFTLFLLFLIGFIIVYYNFFGLGEAVFVCKKRDLDCKINAVKNSIGTKNSKQSKSTSGKKSSVSKVVKTKTSVPSRRNHR